MTRLQRMDTQTLQDTIDTYVRLGIRSGGLVAGFQQELQAMQAELARRTEQPQD